MTSAEAPAVRQRSVLGTLLLVIVLVPLAIAVLLSPLLIRTFLFQPFNIPAGSMKPTLFVGDYIFVSKFSYGYNRYSFPFSPPLALVSGRVFASEPARGDVVVFRLPKDPSIDYVKRVIGMPGDRIQMINGLLHINGTPVRRERIEDFVEREENGREVHIKQWRETLPDGVSHPTLDMIENGVYDNTKEIASPRATIS
jgi:signal peptidase I